MKMVKSLLLGSAAGVVAIAGAQAADLPVKAKPVQYVKICSLYGAGFYYIPGTDTCLKVGGWVRQEIGVGFNGSFSNNWMEVNVNNENTDDVVFRTKGVATLDAREQTAYGTLRTYMALGTSNNVDGLDDSNAGNYFNRWFIQFAGFTFGHATSAFDGWFIAAKYAMGPIWSSDTGDGGYDTLTYTAQLGNGLSASIAAEPNRGLRIINTNTATLSTFTAFTAGAGYGGMKAPDVVGNIRLDQAWGSAQVSAAWHLINAPYYTAQQASGGPADESGWAVAGGMTIKLPALGPRDELAFGGVYTKGASAYSNATNTAIGDFAKFSGPAGTSAPLGSVAFGLDSDAVYGGSLVAAVNNATGLELTETWAVGAGFTHYWNPMWASRLYAGYREVNYSGLANALMCVNLGQGTGAGVNAVANAGCNMDFALWAVSHRLTWYPVKNFSVGLEVMYSELQSATAQNNVMTLGATSRVATPYNVANDDNLSVRLRIQRNFYP